MIGGQGIRHYGIVKGIALLLDRQSASSSALDVSQRSRFDSLVEEHFDLVWRLLRRWGLSAVDADDAAQEVFMVALQKAEKIEPGRERTFLYGTALRVAANARRRGRRAAEHGEESAEAAVSERTPDQSVELRRAVSLLDELLARMPAELARVLILAEIEQVAVPEIAGLEGIPTGTAASRLRRARTVFREMLGQCDARNPFGGSGSGT